MLAKVLSITDRPRTKDEQAEVVTLRPGPFADIMAANEKKKKRHTYLRKRHNQDTVDEFRRGL